MMVVDQGNSVDRRADRGFALPAQTNSPVGFPRLDDPAAAVAI
jgi:hypothetical protein